MNKKGAVDEYIESANKWREELQALRKILLSAGLEETTKWGAPCYTLNGRNVVGIAAFKSHVGLWFFQGALLEDPKSVLINAQEGRTKAQRQWRFDGSQAIDLRLVRAYVDEAIANALAGRELKSDRRKSVDVPVELHAALSKRTKLAEAFAALTPGKQREYALYVSEAKQQATKSRRIEKILPMISAGLGLNDRYRR